MHGRLKAAAEILRQTAAGVETRMKSDKNIITILSSLDAMPLAEKRRSLLFIPKSNRQYWDLLHGPYWPKDGTFVGPALSGVAMIDGLYVPAKDDPWVGHGYSHYSKPTASHVQPPLPQYLPTLRSRCAHGFQPVDRDRQRPQWNADVAQVQLPITPLAEPPPGNSSGENIQGRPASFGPADFVTVSDLPIEGPYP